MNVFVCICLLAIFNITLTGATDCPDFWIPYHGSCYLFGHQHYSFVESEHYCQSHHGGNLLHLNSQEENAFIKDHITYSTDKRWWIGLTDDEIEGVWVWNGSNKKPEFTDWAPHEPNGGHRESCAEIVQYNITEVHWNDASCTSNKPMICEKLAGSDENGIIG